MKGKCRNGTSGVREETGKDARAVYRGRCKEKRKERGGGDGGKRRPGQCIGVGVKRRRKKVEGWGREGRGGDANGE